MRRVGPEGRFNKTPTEKEGAPFVAEKGWARDEKRHSGLGGGLGFWEEGEGE